MGRCPGLAFCLPSSLASCATHKTPPAPEEFHSAREIQLRQQKSVSPACVRVCVHVHTGVRPLPAVLARGRACETEL